MEPGRKDEEPNASQVPTPTNPGGGRRWGWASAALIGTGVGIVVAPVAAVGGIGVLGFGATGIQAGSAAAAFMSTYGGTVASGSLCAVLQSVGAAGLATSTYATCASVGSALAAAGGFLYKRGAGPRKPKTPKAAKEEDEGDSKQENAEALEEEEEEEDDADAGIGGRGRGCGRLERGDGDS